MQAVGYLYEHPAELKPFCIPEGMLGYVFDSWHRKSPHVSGRFDFAYDGVSPPKMLEYNADTPTALIETAIIQWRWLEDPHPGADQFNSVHEKLIARWRELASDRVVYFASLDDGDGEERAALYMADTAMQGGSWVIGDDPAGIILREDPSPIVRNTSPSCESIPAAVTVNGDAGHPGGAPPSVACCPLDREKRGAESCL